VAVIDTAHLFRIAIDLLCAEKVEYITIGGIAAGIWGDPRDTKDADFVVVLTPNQVGPLLRRARGIGFAIEEEIILMNLQISGVARLLFQDRFVDFIVGETEFDRSALARRVRVSLYDREVWVASPEDLILYKLVALRELDIADIRRILIRQGRRLDFAYLETWTNELAEKIGKPEMATKLNVLRAEYGLLS